MRLMVVGLGKLGLPMAAVLSAADFDVYGADLDADLVNAVNAGECPYPEPGLADLLRRHPITAVTDVEQWAEVSDVVFLVVPTPSLADGRFDPGAVCKAAASVARGFRERDQPGIPLVVVCSTVMPGECEGPITAAIEAEGLTVGETVQITYSPEFVALGDVVEGMRHPAQVLIGASSDEAAMLLRSVYVQLYGRANWLPVVRTMPLREAEVAKIAINSALVTKIAFANELGFTCERAGVDASVVADAVGGDPRIGRAYLTPGGPVAGPCVPPETLVLTNQGARRIDSLSVGDLVLSHDGRYHAVEQVMNRHYSGDLLAITSAGFAGQPMMVTPEHPILGDRRIVSPGGVEYTTSIRGERKSRLKEAHFTEGVDFKPAHEYERGDGVFFPRMAEPIGEIASLFEGELLPPQTLTPDMARLVGWYLAEGHVYEDRVGFDLHINEVAYAEDICDLVGSLFYKRAKSVPKGSNGQRIRFTHAGMANWFRSVVGTYSWRKHPPFAWLQAPDEVLINLLRSMWYGDGSNSTGVYTWASVSPQMFEFHKLAMGRLGIAAMFRVTPPRVGVDGVGHRQAYWVQVSNPPEMMKMQEIVVPLMPVSPVVSKRTPRKNVRLKSGGEVRGIRKIEAVPYEGSVWNLEVEGSQSYTLTSGTVHNCFPRDLRAYRAITAEHAHPELVSLAEAAENVSHALTEWAYETMRHLAEMTGVVGVAGLSYRPGTPVVDESLGWLVASRLADAGLPVVTHDPQPDCPKVPEVGWLTPSERPWENAPCSLRLSASSLPWIICTPHPEYKGWPVRHGETVVDLWGICSDEGGRIVRQWERA